MATYSTPSYDSSLYQSNRPAYKDSLVDSILDYHKKTPGAVTDLAVDVATGTGIFARQLQRGFKRVIATDISENMLESARKAAGNSSSIEYIQSPAENLSFLKDKSVDVITVATGAHWIKVDQFVAEAKRVLKPSGSLFIFGYPGFAHFVDFPQCDKMLKDYGLSDDKLGSYWDAGRELLVNGYTKYHEAFINDSWTDIRHVLYPDTFEEPSKEFPVVIGKEPVVMDFKVTWRSLLAFLKTWSTLAIYHKKYPERENAAQVLVREMMASAGETDMDRPVNVEWEEVLLMAHPPSLSDK
ncbi:trans-aconitate methyltransferase 1 [Coemansia erecta]|uniref:Trans-aconitate methyltransferase 1 n=1 Tax=Coemansia asiatica TaxID=1052880 RepID=A0A9W7XCK9_9FUNG|nr:trans-aconitate methyltransferase 1 [Coemansia asiatica]KAJ2846119.1 trans-aconitate methyltransferase 1 [Coemansia erecta]KAJ2863394.1 trans-aconitate methyltransferase 1 [Coemansia asiatica]